MNETEGTAWLRRALIRALFHENDDGTHRDFGTYCQHGNHGNCKKFCKTRPSPCACECYEEES